MGAAIAFVRGKKASAADNRAGECVTEERVGQVSNTRPVGETIIGLSPIVFIKVMDAARLYRAASLAPQG